MGISSRETYCKINFPNTIIYKEVTLPKISPVHQLPFLSPTIIETHKQDGIPSPIVSYRSVTTCTSSMKDFARRDSGSRYRLVRPMRPGHSEVARCYRILSSPLDLQARCMRACMRVRSVVGGARLPVDYAPTFFLARKKKNRRGEPKKSGREYGRFIYDVISEESADTLVARWQFGRTAVLPASRADVNANTNAFKPAALSPLSLSLSPFVSLSLFHSWTRDCNFLFLLQHPPLSFRDRSLCGCNR